MPDENGRGCASVWFGSFSTHVVNTHLSVLTHECVSVISVYFGRGVTYVCSLRWLHARTTR